MTSPQEPGPSPSDHETGTESAAPAPAAHDASAEPIIPDQSPEDTDAGWGEYRDRDDDRLHRDRPPHWED